MPAAVAVTVAGTVVAVRHLGRALKFVTLQQDDDAMARLDASAAAAAVVVVELCFEQGEFGGGGGGDSDPFPSAKGSIRPGDVLEASYVVAVGGPAGRVLVRSWRLRGRPQPAPAAAPALADPKLAAAQRRLVWAQHAAAVQVAVSEPVI